MSVELFTTREDSPGRDVLTVRQLNERIQSALKASFAGTVWVRGEIQRLPPDAARRKHVYFELHETGSSGAAEYQIPVALMGWDRQRFGLGRYLDGQDPDLQLANQIEVCLEAEVDFYPPFGKLSLKIVGVDKTFSLGRLEARRREVLAFLDQQGLMELQAHLVLPDLPLKIGLITSAGSAAEHDFMTGIQSSGRPFEVKLRGAKMQGSQLLDEVIGALNAHVAGGVDVIVITRGGGSRADLSWFDQRDLAISIAECPVPVITAIGHEIDRSIADMVAHHACKTPTAAAEFLADRIEAAASRVDQATDRLENVVTRILDQAQEQIAVERRLVWASERSLQSARHKGQRLAAQVQQRVTLGLGTMVNQVSRLQNRVAACSGAGLATATGRCNVLVGRLGLLSVRALKHESERGMTLAAKLDHAARVLLEKRTNWLSQVAVQVRLQDPARLLARGYTLTMDGRGRLVKRAADLEPGQRITTRFSDGAVPSIVQPGGAAISGTGKTVKGKKRDGGKKEDSTQKTLFR